MVMKAKEIKQLLNRRPFVPLRIHLTDGTAYDIHHPELVMVSQQRVDIGLHPDPDGVVAGVQFCSLLHVVRVEDLKPA
jgi:hypothetical protein